MESHRKQIALCANGQKIFVPDGTTIDEFLHNRQIEPRCVAVEINGEAVLRSEWGRRQLLADDRLEVIRVVAGG